MYLLYISITYTDVYSDSTYVFLDEQHSSQSFTTNKTIIIMKYHGLE